MKDCANIACSQAQAMSGEIMTLLSHVLCKPFTKGGVYHGLY